MAEALIPLAATRRDAMPEYPTVNVISEAGPDGKEHLRARCGLSELADVASQPARGFFQKQGLCGDKAIIVSESAVYAIDASGSVETMTGTVGGSGFVRIDGGLDADYDSIIRFATGEGLYKLVWSTKVVTKEAFPITGGAGATDVAFYKGYWLASEVGSDALYYQLPAATTWSALQFASAEYAPDKLKGVRAFGDLFGLLGERSFEGWYATGSSTSPLEPAGGLTFDIGCRSTHSAVNCQGVLIWVDHTGGVRLCAGDEPKLISDAGLAAEILTVAASDLVAGFFVLEQHPLYVLHLGASATWVYDLSTQRWTRFATLGLDFWSPRFFVNMGDDGARVLATDGLSNQVWIVDPGARNDGSTVFAAEFCAVVPVPEGRMSLGNVILDCEVGEAPLSGQGSAPVVSLQVSVDRKSYGTARERSLGAWGEHNTRPRWNALGMLRAPGGLLKFSVSDPVGRRFTSVRVNAAG